MDFDSINEAIINGMISFMDSFLFDVILLFIEFGYQVLQLPIELICAFTVPDKSQPG